MFFSQALEKLPIVSASPEPASVTGAVSSPPEPAVVLPPVLASEALGLSEDTSVDDTDNNTASAAVKAAKSSPLWGVGAGLTTVGLVAAIIYKFLQQGKVSDLIKKRDLMKAAGYSTIDIEKQILNVANSNKLIAAGAGVSFGALVGVFLHKALEQSGQRS